jgi:hypothetical protein
MNEEESNQRRRLALEALHKLITRLEEDIKNYEEAQLRREYMLKDHKDRLERLKKKIRDPAWFNDPILLEILHKYITGLPRSIR